MRGRGAYGPLGQAVLVVYWALAPVSFVWAGWWCGVNGWVVGGLVLATVVVRPVHFGPLTRIVFVVPTMAFWMLLPKEFLAPCALWMRGFPFMVGYTLWTWLDPVPFVLRLFLLPLLVAVTLAVTFVACTLGFLLTLPLFGLFHAENHCRQAARDRAAERILRQALAHPGAGGDVPRFSLYLRPFKTSGKVDTRVTGVQGRPAPSPATFSWTWSRYWRAPFPRIVRSSRPAGRGGCCRPRRSTPSPGPSPSPGARPARASSAARTGTGRSG